MKHIIKISVLWAAIMLCGAMQVVHTMPHHHHEGSDTVCLAISHCLPQAEDEDCGGCGNTPVQDDRGCDSNGCEGHTHNGTGSCCVITIDFTSPSDKNDVVVPSPFPCGFSCISCLRIGCPYSPENRLKADIATFTAPFDAPREEVSLYTTYLVAAIPPRAPSITA